MKNKTILLVEDNQDDEDLTLRAFRLNNVQSNVVVKRDGAEALNFLLGAGDCSGNTASGPSPAIVLLDLKLPKIDGLGVLQRIRADKRLRLLPVVMLTSSTEDRDIAEAYRLGANSYVRKPVEFSRLLDVMQQLGAYWLCLNQPPPLS